MIFATGNDPGNQNGSLLVDVDQLGNIVPVYVPVEQGSCIDIASDGSNIVVPGIDPTESWAFGNIYLNNGAWSKVRTMTNVIHSLGTCFHNGNLFVATGGHTGDQATFRGYVFKSADLGQSWSSVQVANYRCYDIESFNGNLYVIADESNDPTFYYSDDDGDTWNLINGVVPELSKAPKMVVWNDQLIFLRHTHEIYSIDLLGNVLTNNAPTHVITPTFNMFAVNGVHLYILCTDRIYRTTDLETWEWYCDLGRRCTGLTVWSGFGLIVSEIGANARLLKVPFV
jgi:hypothetical protein